MKFTIIPPQPLWGEPQGTEWDLDGYVLALRGGALRTVARSLGITMTTKTKVGVIREAIREHYIREALLIEIEAHQAWIRDNGQGDGFILQNNSGLRTLMALCDADRIVSGSKTSGHGNKFGWYSVRMINADHAEALEMDAARG